MSDPGYVAAVMMRIAHANSSDAETDDLTVPLAIELSEAKARIETLEAALRWALPLAEEEVRRCRMSPSGHQEFKRQDQEELAKARAALKGATHA